MLTAVFLTLPLRIFHHFAESLDTYFIHFTKLRWRKCLKNINIICFSHRYIATVIPIRRENLMLNHYDCLFVSFPKKISIFIRVIEQKKYVVKI